MSPFAFEIYWMTYETYRLYIRFLVREIIIIAIICVKTPRITSFLIIFIIFAPKTIKQHYENCAAVSRLRYGDRG